MKRHSVVLTRNNNVTPVCTLAMPVIIINVYLSVGLDKIIDVPFQILLGNVPYNMPALNTKRT